MMLLLGDSGIRRTEAAGSQRAALVRSKWSTEVSELTVLGKRNAYRIVPVSSRTVDALRRHWCDRELDFDADGATGPLIASPARSGSQRGTGSAPPRLTRRLYCPRPLQTVSEHDQAPDAGQHSGPTIRS